MSMIKWISVNFSPQAQAIRETLDAQEKRRLNTIIQAIKNAPRDGHFYAPPPNPGEPLRQMTGGNMHVIYRANVVSLGWLLQIVLIEIRDWQMLDDGEVYGRRRKR